MRDLIANMRRDPDPKGALVLGDARLEAGDPWGELPAVAARGETEAWLAAHADLVEQRWGTARLRFLHGLVIHAECDLGELPEPEAFAAEPWVTVELTVSDPKKDDAKIVKALETIGPRLFGLELVGQFRKKWWTALGVALDGMGLVALDISGASCQDAAPLRLPPGLLILEIDGWPPAHPTVERLAVRGMDKLETSVLAWPALRTLDARGTTLDERTEAALAGWGREVIHEKIELVEKGRWGELSSLRGVRWPAPEKESVKVSTAGPLDYVIADGTALRGYLRDDPAWQVQLASPAVSVVSTSRGHHVLTDDGALVVHAPGGAIVSETKAPAARRLVRCGDDVAFVEHDRVVLPDGRAIALDAKALAFTPDGTRLATVDATGTFRELDTGGKVLRTVAFGNPLENVCAIDGGWAVASAEELWTLTGARPVLLSVDPGHRALLAGSGDWVAWSTYDARVEHIRTDGKKRHATNWPDTFTRSEGRLWVQDLAMADGGMALVALTSGALNLLDGNSGSTLKADEHPGQAHRTWIFIHDGQILIAG